MMKKFLRGSLFVFSLAAAVLTSCSDDSDDGSPAAPGTVDAPVGKVVAKVGGATFEGEGQAVINGSTIYIGGVTGNENITIVVAKAAAVGTYDVQGAPTAIGYDAYVSYTSEFNKASEANLYSSIFNDLGKKVGTVTITEVDEKNKTVSGTFSAIAKLKTGDSKEITAGSFNKLPYTTQNLTGSMTAKVNDVAFSASITSGVSNGAGQIAINGQSGSKMITLSVPLNAKAGSSYTFGTEMLATYMENTSTFYMSNGGKVTVTKHDTAGKRIEGTFNFTADGAKGDVNVTSGTFSCLYK